MFDYVKIVKIRLNKHHICFMRYFCTFYSLSLFSDVFLYSYLILLFNSIFLYSVYFHVPLLRIPHFKSEGKSSSFTTGVGFCIIGTCDFCDCAIGGIIGGMIPKGTCKTDGCIPITGTCIPITGTLGCLIYLGGGLLKLAPLRPPLALIAAIFSVNYLTSFSTTGSNLASIPKVNK